MSIEQVNLVAPLVALLLLFLCILVFASAADKPRFRPFLRPALYLCGMVPGLAGVVAGVWLFVSRNQPVAVAFAFLLLEFGSLTLIRVAEKSWGGR